MEQISESLVATALREMEAEVCYCGASKRRLDSFCRMCFYALPRGLRNRLYKTVAEGYAESFNECKEYLRIETDRIRNSR